MDKLKQRSVKVLFCLMVALLAAPLPPGGLAAARPEPAAIVFVTGPLVHAGVARGYVNALAERLAARGITAVALQGAEELVGRYAVLVELHSLADDCCTSPFAFAMRIHPRPPRESLLSPALEAATITLTLQASPAPARIDFMADLLAALAGYSQEACDLALLEALREAAPEHALEGAALEYVLARCLYAAREYDAATAVLEAGLETLPDESTLSVIWRAAIAQNLAQSFQFDAALALDDALIAALEARDPPPGLEDAALLAELYLLRGQHRLYLYEWDAVLADYAAALALTPANTRAYYLRGLLHMTQNAREAALSDLRRFLALEAVRDVPTEHPAIIAQAEAYRAELEALLGTPQAAPQVD